MTPSVRLLHQDGAVLDESAPGGGEVEAVPAVQCVRNDVALLTGEQVDVALVGECGVDAMVECDAEVPEPRLPAQRVQILRVAMVDCCVVVSLVAHVLVTG